MPPRIAPSPPPGYAPLSSAPAEPAPKTAENIPGPRMKSHLTGVGKSDNPIYKRKHSRRLSPLQQEAKEVETKRVKRSRPSNLEAGGAEYSSQTAKMADDLLPVSVEKKALLPSLSSEDQAKVKKAYKDNVLYHGTSSEGRENIIRNGLDVNEKSDGATHASLKSDAILRANAGDRDRFISDSARHNYLTSTKALAKYFAKQGAPTSPALVRVVASKGDFELETDPDFGKSSSLYGLSLRTPKAIPLEHILPSKKGAHAPSTVAISLFQEKLLIEGLDTSKKVAAQLLSDAQSDSEDDFK